MPNIELLKKKMAETGMTIKAIAERSNIERATLYNRLNGGRGEFTATEIVGLTKALHLTKKERDDIFLS
jgi:predicted transcriptional regulator